MQNSQFGKAGAVVLAAGKGTRMYSDTPKVLQRLLEEPMLGYVYRAAEPLFGDRIWTVIGHRADMVRAAFPDHEERFVHQERQLGTGHALQQAWPAIEKAGVEYILVINGDTPLVTADILGGFFSGASELAADISFITLTLADPASFGRVVRDGGEVAAIIEAKDYDEKLHGDETGEINAGIYCLKVESMGKLLPRLTNENKSGEVYVTDLVGLAVEAGLKVLGWPLGDDARLLGINSPAELVRSEEFLREQIVDEYLNGGVIIHNPSAVRIGPLAVVEKGVEMTGPCEIYGRCRLASGVRVESHCRIEDTTVAEKAVLCSFSHVQNASIGQACRVGPYARLRPGAVMEEDSRIGNFVEMKKTRLGKGAKASHLTYLGDADVGAEANIGAGTITCNYDGENKYVTRIGERAFIGSNSALVAPVEIGAGALVGAGSVITKDVPANALGIARGRQRNLERKR